MTPVAWSFVPGVFMHHYPDDIYTEPEPDPDTLANIRAARPKIMSNDPDYRDLLPLQAQLFIGSAQSSSGRSWSDTFNQTVVKTDLAQREARLYWERLGLQTAAMASFVVISLATAGFGGAFLLLGAGAGLAVTGTAAAYSVENYINLQRAAQASMSSSSALVQRSTVDMAAQQAIQDVTQLMEMVTAIGAAAAVMARGKANSQALAKKPYTGPLAGAQWTEQEMNQHLSAAPDGRWALDMRKKYAVTLRTADVPTAHYDHNTNSVVIPSKYNSRQAATGFLHEIGHAEFANKKWSAMGRETKLGRPVYIDLMLREEAEVHGRTIRGKFDMNRAGGFAAEEGEKYYVDAAGPVYRHQKALGGNITDEVARDKAHAAGVDALLVRFRSGDIKTADANGRPMTYTEYYGQTWDRARALEPEPPW
jgi:hypothetical protein